ncbi:MAG: hypothetical protein V7739_10265 [Motiliproteus sp.]
MPRLLFCLLLFCTLPANGSDLQIYLYNTEGASYIDSSGELRAKHHLGKQAMLVELVRTLMLTDGLKPLMTGVSISQGEELLRSQPHSALVDISPSSNKTLTTKWVGPIQSDSVYFFARKKNPNPISSLEDAKTVPSICVRRSSGHYDLLRQQGFNNVIEESSYRVCWDKLISGEATLTSLGENLIPAITQLTADIAPQIQNTHIKLHDRDSYIAFSVDTPDEEVRRWQQLLEQLKASTDYQTLIHHFYCQQDCF